MLRGVLGARLEFEFRVGEMEKRGRNGRRGKRWWGIDRGRGMMLNLFGLTEFGLISSVNWMGRISVGRRNGWFCYDSYYGSYYDLRFVICDLRFADGFFQL